MNTQKLWSEGVKWRNEHRKKGFCTGCGKPLSGRRKMWCSEKCNDAWYERFSWDWIKAKILKRDNHACQRCGWKSGDSRPPEYQHRCFGLDVHHVKPYVDYNDNDERNLITLCEKCHKNTHHGMGALNSKLHRDGKLNEKLTSFLVGGP